MPEPKARLFSCKSGIILEVERGKTLMNNMDLLDMWKCHICEHARYLFSIVPKALLPTILSQRIFPAQTGKASKIPICRVKHASILNRERGNLGITHQGAGSASLHDHSSQNGPVLIAGRKYLYIRLL